jgi:hypothetical protein
MDTMENTKVNRDRLRRVAQRQGLKLIKSARRDPRAIDYNRFWVLDQDGTVVYGDGPGVTLDQAARFLGEENHS